MIFFSDLNLYSTFLFFTIPFLGQIFDGALDEQHPYRIIMGMKNKDEANLVNVGIESFSLADDDSPGYAYAIKGHLSEIQIIFLYSFLSDMMQYQIGGQKEQEAFNDAVSNGTQVVT